MDLYAFKIYMLDVGLLLAMTDLDASVIIDGNRIFTEFKGALTEQYVLQQLVLRYEPYYYAKSNSTQEIDFLLQEFNREANTTGSKCQNSDIAHVVVELKSEIEKIREQIQNIE